MTDHENQYDPQLQWVIDEVIHAVTNKLCTELVWHELYEQLYQTTSDDAWDEYQQQQLVEAEGEARFEQEQYHDELCDRR